MNTEQFITALGLSEIADTIHKHPKSGSDYSIRELLEKFGKIVAQEEQDAVIQAITDPENQPNQFGIETVKSKMNRENLEKELFAIFASEETDLKQGSDGDYETVKAISMYSYNEVAVKITSLIQSITDAENERNQ